MSPIMMGEIVQTLFDKDSVDVTGSTSSRKDTRKEEYATETSVSEGMQEYATETREDIYVFTTSLNKIHEPTTYLEAVKDSRWVVAMNQEMEALNRNKT
ncbi:hypothetical protein Tco_0950126 [Tanacetum coccineum]